MWVQDSSSPISPPEFLCPWHDEPAFRVSAEPGGYVVHVDSNIPPITLNEFLQGIVGSEEGASVVFPEETIYLQGFVRYETLGVKFRREFGWHWLPGGEEYGGTLIGGTSIWGHWWKEKNQKNNEQEAN